MNRNFFAGLVLSALAVVIIAGCEKDDNGDSKVLSPREKAIKDYEENYLGSHLDDPGWTGSVNGCNAGTVSQEAHDKTMQRINYFRRICGLPDNVTLNPDQTDMCQESSLIMKAANSLSHFPDPDWPCWTQDGYDAAGAANIAWASHPGRNHSSLAVTGYIEDPGDHNYKVGHRAWKLLPGLEQMGHGSTNRTNTLMWGDNYDRNATSDPFVAYPPDNYIPGELVFPRWSFSITGANFDNAEVAVSSDGSDYTISYEARVTTQGWPDSRIVWLVQGLQYPITKDMEFDVTVSGIQGAPQSSYSYTVKVFATDAAKQKAKQGGRDYEIMIK